MADTIKVLAQGTLTTSNATLGVAVPSLKKWIVKEVVLANKAATPSTATIKFNGINIVPGKSIINKDALIVKLNSVLETTYLIEGLSDTASAIDYYISGIEIDV